MNINPHEIQKFLNEYEVAEQKLLELFKTHIIKKEDYQLINSALSNMDYILTQSFFFAERYITLLEKNNLTQEQTENYKISIERLSRIRDKMWEKLKKYEPDLPLTYGL